MQSGSVRRATHPIEVDALIGRLPYVQERAIVELKTRRLLGDVDVNRGSGKQRRSTISSMPSDSVCGAARTFRSPPARSSTLAASSHVEPVTTSHIAAWLRPKLETGRLMTLTACALLARRLPVFALRLSTAGQTPGSARSD